MGFLIECVAISYFLESSFWWGCGAAQANNPFSEKPNGWDTSTVAGVFRVFQVLPSLCHSPARVTLYFAHVCMVTCLARA